jgi:hypothetical protein
MPTRDQVIELMDGGHSYETAARALHVPAGQAYMIATGRPAPEHLVNPPPVNPTRNPRVIEWARSRAARELNQER